MVLCGLARDAVGVVEGMESQPPSPPLRALHPDTALSPAKLVEMERLTTRALEQSLLPGQSSCLKTRPDGTILDGHHRIHILRERGVNVDALPREVVVKGNL